MAVDHGEAAVGRHDVDMVGFDAHPCLHPRHSHGRRHLDDLSQVTFVPRRQMDDHDERHAAIWGHC